MNARKSFWAQANDLNLSNEGVHKEFGVESLSDYAESRDTAQVCLDILEYGINKCAIGLQGIWAALGVNAVYKCDMAVDAAKQAIDEWAARQDTTVQQQGELAV